jgi:methylmalonyl-CoA mutase N-terminal domain/subunit
VITEAGIEKFGKFDSSKLNVEMTVNGINVPLLNSLLHLNDHLDDHYKGGVADGKETIMNDIAEDFKEFLAMKYNVDNGESI